MIPSKAAAAVAIIRVRSPRDSVLLLRRNVDPDDPWSGHFSFPGGRKEDIDTTLLDTCRRETLEETGVALPQTNNHAALEAAYAGSRINARILVQPYLFHLEERPHLQLDRDEIQSYTWLEIDAFKKQHLHVDAEVLPNIFYPAFPIDDYYLWGFTYGLLKHLLQM